MSIRQMCPIPKAWASFIIQTLESTSNQSEFIVKKCMAMVAILNHEQIYVGILIYENIKYMDDAQQQACGHFFAINELCMLSCGYFCVINELSIYVLLMNCASMQPINKDVTRRIQTHPINEGGEQFYHLIIH